MAHRVGRPRVRLAAPVALVFEDEHGIEIEAPIRLAPGRTVDIVADDEASVRLAVVWTWTLVRLVGDGPMYRGTCRWV
jgi:hypothetical protein